MPAAVLPPLANQGAPFDDPSVELRSKRLLALWALLLTASVVFTVLLISVAESASEGGDVLSEIAAVFVAVTGACAVNLYSRLEVHRVLRRGQWSIWDAVRLGFPPEVSKATFDQPVVGILDGDTHEMFFYSLAWSGPGARWTAAADDGDLRVWVCGKPGRRCVLSSGERRDIIVGRPVWHRRKVLLERAVVTLGLPHGEWQLGNRRS